MCYSKREKHKHPELGEAQAGLSQIDLAGLAMLGSVVNSNSET